MTIRKMQGQVAAWRSRWRPDLTESDRWTIDGEGGVGGGRRETRGTEDRVVHSGVVQWQVAVRLAFSKVFFDCGKSEAQKWGGDDSHARTIRGVTAHGVSQGGAGKRVTLRS